MTAPHQLLQILLTRDCAADALYKTKVNPRDGVLCQCCGETFTLLKRHLQNAHNMDENTYRRIYCISNEEMLVSVSYSARKRRCIEAYGSDINAKF